MESLKEYNERKKLEAELQDLQTENNLLREKIKDLESELSHLKEDPMKPDNPPSVEKGIERLIVKRDWDDAKFICEHDLARDIYRIPETGEVFRSLSSLISCGYFTDL